MAGKYHLDSAAYAEGEATPAIHPGSKLLRAYVEGYQYGIENGVAPELKSDETGMEAAELGAADAAAGLYPGFTAEVAPEPEPPPEPEVP